MVVFVRVYQGLAKRVGRVKLLRSVYFFFAANLAVFALLTRSGVAVGVPFYLWVGVFNYASIAQFWALAADVYTPEQGKRLFAVLGIGSSVGAVLGARVARSLVAFGPSALMSVAAAILIVCIGLLAWVEMRVQAGAARGARNEVAEEPLGRESAVALLLHDKYLLLLAGLTLVLNWVNSNGEYVLDRTLLETLGTGHDEAAAARFIGAFKADYFAWVNLVGVLLQFLVVSRVLQRLGPARALFILPLVALSGYGVLLAAPVLALIRLAKIAENSIDYSIQNTARQALYLVTSRAEKYVGKTAVDTFFVRFGDVLSAALVWFSARMSVPTAAFASINLGLVAVWLVLVVFLAREYRRRAAELALAPAGRPVGSGLSRFAAAAVALGIVATAGRADAAPDKRPLPDYEGRPAEPTTPEDVAIWVPRTALAPLYLVTEYGVRRPLGALISGAERAHLPADLYDFFFFGPEHKGGIVPIAFVDFGFNPSVGLYAFWDDAFFPGHDLRFHGTTWGTDWLAGVFTDRLRGKHGEALTLKLAAIKRPDHAFFGTGPETLQRNISRYAEDQLEGNLLAELPLWRSSKVATSVGIRSVSLGPGHFHSDPSLEVRAAEGAFAVPYGFDRGYTAQTSRVYGAFDSRRPRPEPGSGVRVELEGEEGADIRRSPGSAWIRYGASAGVFVDVNGKNRVLSLSGMTRFADRIGPNPVPFTELVSLGGEGPLRGFYPGRLVDRSAVAVELRYRWPIWVWLDGSLQAATGNVFGDHLEDFTPSRFRLSGAVGVESVGSRDGSFELLVGVGTETFDQGTKVDSVRIAVGTNRGF
jgi:ATP/ADP translocase